MSVQRLSKLVFAASRIIGGVSFFGDLIMVCALIANVQDCGFVILRAGQTKDLKIIVAVSPISMEHYRLQANTG